MNSSNSERIGFPILFSIFEKVKELENCLKKRTLSFGGHRIAV